MSAILSPESNQIPPNDAPFQHTIQSLIVVLIAQPLKLLYLFWYGRGWQVETLNDTVDEEIEALPRDMRAKLARIIQMIQEIGLDQVHEPHVKHIEGRLWEMRLIGRSGIARALYVTVIGRRVVVVRVFIKKTEKVPRREIELALDRAKLLDEEGSK